MPKHVVSGTTIDEVYDKNLQEIKKITEERDQLKGELSQVKQVNEKLLERVDYLQNIIDKEASANVYYFNYPPKPDKTLQQLTGGPSKITEKVVKRAETSPSTKESDNAGDKIKKMYDD